MNKKLLSSLKNDMMPRITARYDSLTSGKQSSGNYRPTEDAAIKMISSSFLLQLELTVTAIGSVYDMLSPDDRELIRLKYWSGEYTPDGIALKLNMARTTIYSRLNLIHVEIARRLGYINLDGSSIAS